VVKFSVVLCCVVLCCVVVVFWSRASHLNWALTGLVKLSHELAMIRSEQRSHIWMLLMVIYLGWL